MRRYILNAFTLPLLVLLLFTGIIISIVPKTEGHIAINQHHDPVLDFVFSSITHLGDGITAAVVIFILFFINLKHALIFLACFATSAGVTQFLKKIIYHDAFRPVKFFEGIHELYVVEGVKMNQFNSFPSGHATTSFMLFFCMAMLTKNKWLQLAFLIIATLSAFSRVYLSQHFLEDIFVGAIIGTFVSVILFYFLDKKIPGRLSKPIHRLKK